MKSVTICVPTYNSEKTLAETLSSILNQTFKNVTVKVFDNASIDRTVEVAKSIAAQDPRVEVLAFDKNVGAEGNFDRCLAAATGDYTAIFHADDVYEPEMVEKQVSFLERHPQCVAVATHASMIDKNGEHIGLRFLPAKIAAKNETSFSFSELFDQVLNFGNFVTCPSVLARSDVYRNQIKIWDGSRFGTSADLDVWLRLSRLGRFGILTAPLMRYRVSESSFTVRETKRRFTEHDILRVLREYVTHPELSAGRYRAEREIRFHEFKDAAARRLNILRGRRSDLEFPPFKGSKYELLPLLFRSPYHFKFLSVSYGIFAVTGFLKFTRMHK